LLLIVTNDLHGLTTPNPQLLPGTPFDALVYDFTFPVWIIALYAYILTLYAIGILVVQFARSHRLYRGQVGTVALGVLIPLMGSVLTLTGLNFTFQRDLTPYTFALGNLIVTWGLFRFRLFNILPVARDALVETMPDAVVVLDAQNRVVDLNPAALQGLGKPAKETVGRPVNEVYASWAGLGEKLQQEQQVQAEIIAAEGAGWRHFDLSISPLYNHRRDLTGRLVVVRDVTARKEAEEALRAARDKLEHRVAERTAELAAANAQLVEQVAERQRAATERERLLARIQEQARQVQQIIDTVPEGVFLLDPEYRAVVANPAAERDLSVLAEARVGETLTYLAGHPLDRLLTSPPSGRWHELVAAGRIFELIARPIEAGPTPRGWVFVVRDVTQERRSQQHIHQQERLAAVGQLAAGVAHDFNNILTSIMLNAELLSQEPELASHLVPDATAILAQSRRAAQLIRQLLDFSRATTLERLALNLVPFLKEQLKLLERMLPENIRLRFTPGTDSYTISADPTRIQQVIMNLAVNARDAMPEGGDLRISLDRVHIASSKQAPLPDMAPGDWVRITVADTGVGIFPDALPHIFEPFFTTKTQGEGSGLGLAQVHGIVKQHGGEIEVTSAPDIGTTFTLYLPALTVEGQDPGPAEQKPLPCGQGQVVLLVEDNAEVRQALLDSLQALHYQGQEAANGREALVLLDAQGDSIDLVLSDVVMPDIGGVALFRAIQERGLGIPVVLLTGHAIEREMEQLRREGLAGWLRKPPDLAQLAQELARVLAS
jgi:PAS domain S-box-containing protein